MCRTCLGYLSCRHGSVKTNFPVAKAVLSQKDQTVLVTARYYLKRDTLDRHFSQRSCVQHCSNFVRVHCGPSSGAGNRCHTSCGHEAGFHNFPSLDESRYWKLQSCCRRPNGGSWQLFVNLKEVP